MKTMTELVGESFVTRDSNMDGERKKKTKIVYNR